MIKSTINSIFNITLLIALFIGNSLGQSGNLVYCDSYATSTSYEEIIEVTIGSWSNHSGPAFGSTYQDFTAISGPFLAIGNTYDISITTDFPPGYSYAYTCYVKVYIDYNHDSIYSEPDEIAFEVQTTSSNNVTGTFMVSFGAISANTGMRVVMEEASSSGDVTPCGTYTWGETEDYLCIIAPQIINDAGVTEIIQPFNNLIENSLSPVEVTVQNFGTDTIMAMNINYEIDGGPPVTYAFVGLLAPAADTIVTLTNITVPGGFYDICAYTVLAGDTNTFNDETCLNLFATPQYEAEMNSITTLEDGCDLGLQDVSVIIVNLGDTISVGNLDLSFTHDVITTVTETYPSIIYPFDTISYTFNTQIDLTVSASTDFEIYTWLDLVDDPIQTNDTSIIVVWSGLTPPDPIANDITIWSGESGIINIVNIDSTLIYNWYDVDTNLISNDFSLTTPVLIDTTVFFVETMTGVEPSAFSTPFNSNNGQAGNMFDLTSLTSNITIESFDINIDNSVEVEVYYKPGSYIGFETNASAWTLLGSAYVISNGLNNPSGLAVGGLTIPTGETYALYITVTSGDGMNYTNLSTSPYWTDGNLLIDNSCGKSYPFGASYSPRGWNGTIYYSSIACSSTLIPVTANIQYADYDAAVWNVIAPVSGVHYSPEDVVVEVYNNGLLPISNFPISYTHNFNPVVQEIYTGTLSPGDTLIYTFSQQVSLGYYYYFSNDICVFTGLLNDSISNNDTSCINIYSFEGPCSFAYPYLYINDPPVSGATTFSGDSDWWRFELPGDNCGVIVSLCSSVFDTKLEVYSDCGGNYIGYNDDYCGMQSQLNFSFLSAGTYYAKVYGYGSYFGSYELSINSSYGCNPPPPDFIITDVSCYGGNDGEIDLTLIPFSGITLPVIYLWSNNQTTEDLTGMTAGIYEVTVTDVYGVQVVGNVTISEPAIITVAMISVDVTTIGGSDGEIDITVTGGIFPYNFLWSNGDTTEDLDSIYGGLYSVTITDDNNCSVTETILLNAPLPFDIQYINLPEGWSFMSTYIDPFEVQIDSVFEPVVNQLIICKDGDGLSYWPVYNVNMIDSLTIGDGYQVKMQSNQVLPIEGEMVIPEITTINIPQGWSYLGYLRYSAGSIVNMLYPVVQEIIIVKDGDGNIYWPIYGVNLIGDMIPGEGYQIKMNTQQVFLYPAN